MHNGSNPVVLALTTLASYRGLSLTVFPIQEYLPDIGIPPANLKSIHNSLYENLQTERFFLLPICIEARNNHYVALLFEQKKTLINCMWFDPLMPYWGAPPSLSLQNIIGQLQRNSFSFVAAELPLLFQSIIPKYDRDLTDLFLQFIDQLKIWLTQQLAKTLRKSTFPFAVEYQPIDPYESNTVAQLCALYYSDLQKRSLDIANAILILPPAPLSNYIFGMPGYHTDKNWQTYDYLLMPLTARIPGSFSRRGSQNEHFSLVVLEKISELAYIFYYQCSLAARKPYCYQTDTVYRHLFTAFTRQGKNMASANNKHNPMKMIEQQLADYDRGTCVVQNIYYLINEYIPLRLYEKHNCQAEGKAFPVCIPSWPQHLKFRALRSEHARILGCDELSASRSASPESLASGSQIDDDWRRQDLLEFVDEYVQSLQSLILTLSFKPTEEIRNDIERIKESFLGNLLLVFLTRDEPPVQTVVKRLDAAIDMVSKATLQQAVAIFMALPFEKYPQIS